MQYIFYYIYEYKLFALITSLVYKSVMTRKNLTTRIDNDLQKEAKKLAIDLEVSFNDLLEEAIRDLLEKYKKQSEKE